MKDNLEQNMYVRTKYGYIARLNKINKTDRYTEYEFDNKIGYDYDGFFHSIVEYCIDDIEIIKASHNIIDLIEVGDYVNGEKVIRIDKDPFIKGQINLWTNTITSNYWGDISLSPIIEKDIKSIVTKEMFSSMEYRLGDDK